MDIVKRFRDFITNTRPEDKLAILFHTDADGICAGFICAEALRRLFIKPALLIPKNYTEINSSLVKQLKQKKVAKSICVDIAIDQHPELIKEINNFSDLLIIDHHLEFDGKPFNNIQTEHTVTIKQTLLGIEYYYPASKLAYDLFSELVDISDLDWVAACGIIGDLGYEQCKSFVDRVLKKYNFKSREDIFETDLGRLAYYIAYAGTFRPHKIKLAMQTLAEARKPEDVLVSKLARIGRKLDKEFKYWIRYVKENASLHSDLMLCEIKPKHRLKGLVITALSRQLPDKTLIVYQRDKDEYLISARRHDQKIAVNELLEAATKGICVGTAGGHKPAAGAVILKKDLELFRKRVVELAK